ncbi:MAG: tetratricopeptide repeat protein [Candidatus Melainabacteria bacterium]|nr:tetratricopeptide repeat protein [Candidatus Melainabacteria bacterium]
MTRHADDTRPIKKRSGNNLFPVCLAATLTLIVLTADPADAAKRRRSSGATSGGGGGGPLVLTTPPPRNPMEHNNRGVELGSKGLWNDAIREHEEALNADPESEIFRRNLSSAHLHYADSLASKKKWYEAIGHYREALYADPANLPADSHLDNCLKAIGKNPDDYAVRAGLADEADIAGNYPVAIVEYRKCVKMSDSGPSRFRLARVLYKQGKVVEAYEELRIAINKEWKTTENNELANCHCLMGDILWEVTIKAKEQGRGPLYLKRLSNVGICYRRAATINPNNTDAIRGIINAAKEAVAINDSFDNNLMLGSGYSLGGDFERAKQSYNKCWQLNPNSPVLHKARTSFHLMVVSSAMATPKLLQESTLKIEKELEKRPDDPELLYIYGRGQEALKSNDLALRAYEKARSINPHVNPDLLAGIERITGQSQGGEPTKVASKSGPTGAPATAGGDAGGGGSDVAKPPAPKIDPNAPAPSKVSPQAYAAIEGQIASGDNKGAETALSAILDKFPEEGRAYLLRGGIKEQTGDMPGAAVDYRMGKSFKAAGAVDALKQLDGSRFNKQINDAKQLIQAGNFVESASTLKQITRMAPDLSTPHRLLAEALDKLGEKKEAERERKKADDLDKKD